MILIMLSCKAPPQAPTELSELARFFFREHHSEDPDLIAGGADNLSLILEDIDPEAPALERSFAMASLQVGDVAGVTRPDRDPADADGLAVADRSPWPLSEHLRYMVLNDLVETSLTASVYNRSFDLDDPDCFVQRTCESMRTENLIYRDTLLLKVEYTLHKEYRWVTAGPLGDAVIARGWIEQEAHGENDANHIYQNYEVDLYLPAGQQTLRLFAVWTESDYAGLEPETAYSLSMTATADALQHLDQWIADNQ